MLRPTDIRRRVILAESGAEQVEKNKRHSPFEATFESVRSFLNRG
jgi:hypothetical protein